MNSVAQSRLADDKLETALAAAQQRYVEANPASAQRHQAAKASMPGGNTRAVMWYPPFPLALVGGEGCRVTDLDGHRYLDLVSEYGAGFYGHSNPLIAAALDEVIRDGVLLGAPNRYEARYAAALCERFPALERLRFCNSGTEANIMALSTARAITGRDKILVFRDGYHGGVLTFAHGGSPLNLPFPYVFADYNDIAGSEALIHEYAQELAAVIVEPMMGGGGCIPASHEFLLMLRKATQESGSLLIFDEVITSRLAYSGLHGEHGIIPDLLTMGKYLGGGASFGCFGGSVEVMERFDPASTRAFSHGGTFNNNVLSMAAGLCGLTQVLTETESLRINALGDQLRSTLNQRLADLQLAATVLGRGSVMNLHFCAGPIDTPAQLGDADTRLLQLWQLEMLHRGQFVTPRGMIVLSLPFAEAEVDQFIAAFDDFLNSNTSLLQQRA
jgi:glutamate-1-semialdehyde 2,1-aminomutase